MMRNSDTARLDHVRADNLKDRFTTLNFERDVATPLATLWQTWTAPAARTLWATPSCQVEFVQADTQVGGREVLRYKVETKPDIRREVGWLELSPKLQSVHYEVVSSGGVAQSAALVTADFSGTGERSRLNITVQLSALAENSVAGYKKDFDTKLEHFVDVTKRTMVLERLIKAPRTLVWGAWINPVTLPQWWGPEGFSCRTKRINLQTGGEWVFDMIGPDGTIFPNHHLYGEVRPEDRIGYTLLWGENGPKHADAWVSFEDNNGATKVTLAMAFSTAAEFQNAKSFGAVELGQQTLGKLERFVEAS